MNLKFNALLLALALAAVTFSSDTFAADCTATECECILVTYHDPAAAEGQDIVTDKFSWARASGQLNRRLGKWEAIRFQFSYEDNGVQACCSVIDNNTAQSPWAGLTISHFPSNQADRNEVHFLLYGQTPEYGEWFIVTAGDGVNAVESPPPREIDNSMLPNLLTTADSRLIALSEDQDLIDRALLLNAENRIDLLNGC